MTLIRRLIRFCFPDRRHVKNCRILRERFEGTEAIFVEMGAIRVRVIRVRPKPRWRFVDVLVEEIPTPRLGCGIFDGLPDGKPVRWDVGAGYLSRFSEHNWCMGYGGWRICKDPALVEAVTRLAKTFPADLPGRTRYARIGDLIQGHESYTVSEAVFPE